MSPNDKQRIRIESLSGPRGDKRVVLVCGDGTEIDLRIVERAEISVTRDDVKAVLTIPGLFFDAELIA